MLTAIAWLATASIVTVVTSVTAAPAADEVASLPGLHKQPYWKHYSGYLKASGTKHLHYWFVESANKPQTDPLVLWMNGGPGCSSLLGLMTENGPFRVSKNGSGIYYNKNSWNNHTPGKVIQPVPELNVANMLYLEAPAGVGFSYSDDRNYTTDDDQVAKDNYLALQDFFRKFPEYLANDFYVTGESYGGIYVPTLSSLVLQNKTIHFKGMAIGNGITNFDTNENSLLYFAYFHGIIGDVLWGKMLSTCCPGQVKRCQFVHKYIENSECSTLVGEASELISGTGLNEYNLYGPCEVPKPQGFVYLKNAFVHDLKSFAFQKHPRTRKKLEMIRQSALYKESVRVTPPCLDYEEQISYLNTQAVRKALHIPASVQDWDVCSVEVGAGYVTLYSDVTALYRQVLQAGKRVLVYNGDVDMACNFLGDEWFVENLHQQVLKQRQPWYFNDGQGSRQVAGFVKEFEGLTLTTIRGAGHMVPQDKPVPALQMFARFLGS